MVVLTEEMKAQLMKVVGISDVSEFDSLVKQHSPNIENFDASLQHHSPFDLQLILFKEQLESRGMNNFSKLSSHQEKIKYVYETLIHDQDFKDINKVCLRVKSKKDSEKSKKLRELGNKNFQKKVNEEAIRYYNESILAGPIVDGQGQEVALGLGNRSVVLYNMSEYENCLSDIRAALHFGYPENLQYKVYERQGRCHQALGEYQKARASYEAALKTLAVGKIADEKKPAVEAELRSALEQVEAETEQMAVAVLGGGRFSIRRPHTQFPSMSEAVTIRYEEDVGRHAVATQNIEPGDVILVEKPLAWTVSVNNFEHFCQNCVNNVGRTPIPSPSHESGVFCCYDCLTHFQTTFPFDDLDFVQLFSSGTSEGSASVMLAFRCLVQRPLAWYLEKADSLFSQHNPSYGVQEDKDWKLEGDENIYKAVFNLVNHISHLSQDKEITTIIKTVVLLRLLVCQGYFGDEDKNAKKISDSQLLIGRLLFIFQLGMNFNQHGIYAADGKIETGKKLPLVDVGASFYPNLVLLNHSCSPNTIRVNEGKTTYLVAKHAIKRGEEILDCYGPHHLSHGKADRQKTISSAFMFQCQCQGCDHQWPLWSEIEARLSPGEMAQLGTSLSKYQTNFREHKFDAARGWCVEYLRKLDQMNIKMPHRNYEIASMALSSCFWATLQ